MGDEIFIVDDDEAVRSSLAQLIEDEELGIVAGEAEDGAEVTASYLNDLHIDILCIDLLMPERDGLETIRAIKDEFHGKYLMLSQVETKELIGYKIYTRCRVLCDKADQSSRGLKCAPSHD